MTKYIIDTDPGTDDAVAFIAALNSPELNVLALTTVGGNANLEDTTRNALDLMTHLGRPDMPVYRGADTPLTGEFPFAYDFHGPGGLSIPLPDSGSTPHPLSAVDYIHDAARDHSGELVILALGPLTNIAQALLDRPELRDRIKELIVMGGAVEVPGNVTPHAEFNTYCDPRAANVVFRSGRARHPDRTGRLPAGLLHQGRRLAIREFAQRADRHPTHSGLVRHPPRPRPVRSLRPSRHRRRPRSFPHRVSPRNRPRRRRRRDKGQNNRRLRLRRHQRSPPRRRPPSNPAHPRQTEALDEYVPPSSQAQASTPIPHPENPAHPVNPASDSTPLTRTRVHRYHSTHEFTDHQPHTLP